ncbi:unnamed protein product [Rotaria sp. Silwood1]|nr:unnamed protein product [Rotaria sp. Silwood1]CAF3486368.1 unnamed protein product [Rotaria sp. Silwood1]CAF3488154.1 unnamed protein product [Rotaria sp. Silwood1]CAF4544081.1 unnamed protein product [Rotaria sp. Silwood1]CAF4642687.1 unnamed protein product [Rotaria sp. Silwood1]
MWRLASYIYRTFRNVAHHRCAQDIIVPVTTVRKTDDESNYEEKQESLTNNKIDIDHIIKNNQFTFQNFEKLQEYLFKTSLQQLILKLHVIKPIELPKTKSIVEEVQTSPTSSTQQEESLDSLFQADENCMKTLKNLSELNEETTSIINNQSAIEAFEAGDVQLGIETLQTSAKYGTNSAALYNLGICYERGIGVEKDRTKACDYYRQASMLGHSDAFFNLTFLSNHIDTNDNDDEDQEENFSNESNLFPFSFTKLCKEEQSQSWSDYQLSLTKTLACLS